MTEPTPLMKQYSEIKDRHRDAIVLFRLGDFYEMFGEDAEVASRVLQIALTTRDKNKENPLPMCGIPHFAAESYIGKLISAGHKVAVCEQVEDPREAKGIVRREVVRLVTPGTHAPESPKRNNYILAVCPRGVGHGIAAVDFSTGEFTVFESARPLEDELSRFDPSEVVFPESLADDIHYAQAAEGGYVAFVEDLDFDYAEAYRKLLRHFGVSSLEGFGCEGMEAAISAAGALLCYLEDTLKNTVRFRRISVENQATHMFLDQATQRNLELVRGLAGGSAEGSLLWALDSTLTPMGGRFLRSAVLSPLLDLEEIRGRLSAVRYLVEDYELIEKLRGGLRKVQDVERLAQRMATGSANPRDLIALKGSLVQLPAIKSALSKALDGKLSETGEGIYEFPELKDLITRAILDHPAQGVREGGVIKSGYNEEIDELRGISLNAKDYIASIEADERKKTGISSLKVGYNRIHGYYIEVTKPNLPHVPEHYHRKQTLVGGERFITPELKEYESRVLGAEERLKALEHRVFLEVLEKCARWAPRLMDTAALLAVADFLVSMAVVAKRHNYAMPHVTDDLAISIKGGRHPVIERLPMSERFIPNDAFMDEGQNRMVVITGPNMAGKSTYMRQVALIVLMAQMGSFVPAEEAAIGVADRIFTRIGAADLLTKGQSTFMVEMIETANILNNATRRSLIVLDEIGRGTSTFDGISIAWAAAEYISREIGARTMFATHYIELTELSRTLDGVRNLNIAVKEWGDEIIFLRKIEPGPADKSYGIQVARLAGLPPDVLDKARAVLSRLEKQHLAGSTAHFSQLGLFGSPKDAVAEEVLSLDIDALAPEEVVAWLRKLKDKAQGP